MSDQPRLPVLFLDTNLIHFGRLYVGFASQHDLPIDGNLPDGATTNHRSSENLSKGAKLVKYLRAARPARVYYSPITALEAITGRLRAQAMQAAAGEGVPGRWWSRVGEQEVFERLGESDYSAGQKELENICDCFRLADIDLNESSLKDSRAVWSVSARLLGLVYLEMADCVLYASALVEMADCFLTDDGHLRRVAQFLHAPGCSSPSERPRFASAQSHLLEALTSLTGTRVTQLPRVPYYKQHAK